MDKKLSKDVQMQLMRPGQLEAAARNFPVAYVPFGLIEWHGRHLPLGNDAIKAHAILVKTAERFGGVDVAVNSAGLNRPSPIKDITPELLHDVAGVQFFGAYYFMRHFCNAMAESGGGSLVNVTSATAIAVPVALAPDCNPGSSMTETMQIILALASMMLRMTPEEGLVAATVNAAAALRAGDVLGSLAPGRQCDVVIWEVDDYRAIPYHYGVNLVAAVVKRGSVVVPRGVVAG